MILVTKTIIKSLYLDEFLNIFQLSKPPSNDQDRHFQFTIREKLREVTLGKCKGVLLQDLAHQMKQLKEDLENRKEETVISKKNLNPEANEQSRRARPSLSELFPGLCLSIFLHIFTKFLKSYTHNKSQISRRFDPVMQPPC